MNIENLKVDDIQEHQRKTMAEGDDRAWRRNRSTSGRSQWSATAEGHDGTRWRMSVVERNLHSEREGKCFVLGERERERESSHAHDLRVELGFAGKIRKIIGLGI